MPSQSYVAAALYRIHSDADWGDASDEDQKTHMELAKVAIAAITSWQAQLKGNGDEPKRYHFEQFRRDGERDGWAIYDRKGQADDRLGVVHDALLAQQIIDDLNKREGYKPPLPVKTDD
jgi:hypothetical protein